MERGTFADSDPALWWQTMQVKVRGPYLMTRHLVPVMRKGGKIINLTSGKGYSAGVNSNAYHVSKAALNMMTEGLANELWNQEIEVNCLVPGPTATAIFDAAMSGAERSAEDILSRGPDTLPKGLPARERVKHPDEVAKMALQTASYPSGGPTGRSFLWPDGPFDKPFRVPSGLAGVFDNEHSKVWYAKAPPRVEGCNHRVNDRLRDQAPPPQVSMLDCKAFHMSLQSREGSNSFSRNA